MHAIPKCAKCEYERHQGMTSDDAAAPRDGASSRTAGRLPFDTTVAHQARVYDYLLGGCSL